MVRCIPAQGWQLQNSNNIDGPVWMSVVVTALTATAIQTVLHWPPVGSHWQIQTYNALKMGSVVQSPWHYTSSAGACFKAAVCDKDICSVVDGALLCDVLCMNLCRITSSAHSCPYVGYVSSELGQQSSSGLRTLLGIFNVNMVYMEVFIAVICFPHLLHFCT